MTMGWTDDSPWDSDALAMPEAPRDPSIDPQMEEPAEEGWPRGRDTTLALYLSRISSLKVAVNYLLDAGDGPDKERARSMARDLLKRMDAEDSARWKR